MNKSELLSTYTAEQLAEMVLELTWKTWKNSEECEITHHKFGIVTKCPYCGKENVSELDEKSESLIRNRLTDEVHELKSEVEKYRKAFEGAKKERDCQIAEYQKKIEELYYSLRTLEGNLKVSNVVIEETIKNENGEESNAVKFDSIKQFAEYVKCFYTINLDYIQKILQGKKGKQNNFENIANFLQKEPIKVADMLINAMCEPCASVLSFGNPYSMYDISELRQIAEHLLVYCNHNGEAEE